MPSMEMHFQTSHSLPTPQPRMRWGSGILEVEVGYELLPFGFVRDAAGTGSDRV